MSIVTQLFESIAQFPGKFATIATHDPLAAVMLLCGSVLMALAMGVFGLLTLGAVADFLTPSQSSPPHQPAR
ncbi:hypothetical protein ACKVMT_08465 [Halobacteriales archaeon Cl-PHB]